MNGSTRETPFFKREFSKADGRKLWLYARENISADIIAPQPLGADVHPNPHLRYHPLRGEWVTYAPYRQARTFLPPADYDPLAPSDDAEAPTELPSGRYDVAVFENRFPSFMAGAHDAPNEMVPTAAARGACEVVVFAQDSQASLRTLPLWHIELLFHVWADRTRSLGAREEVAYVFPFENRGVEIGVTLTHPHGQIYAYPFVPPIAARELEMQLHHWNKFGVGLIEQMLAHERRDGRRVVVDADSVMAIVPACARYPYELWIAPVRAVPSLTDLNAQEIRDFARALKACTSALDALFGKPMPYVMAFHQGPTDGSAHPEAHVHIEIYPALRMKDRLKYLAGSEVGAGVFTADTLPEDTAAELRRVVESP